MSASLPSQQHATLSYSQAAATVHGYAAGLAPVEPVETVSLLDGLGRVLASPVVADRDQPPFARSIRDGFACRAAEITSGAPLAVIGLLKAGESWTGAELGSLQAIEIMTGAPLPPGADCVVMIEHVERDVSAAVAAQGLPDTIRFSGGGSLQVGDNFIPAGKEARTGAVLVAPGTRLGPSHLAAAASTGMSRLEVFPRPRVAILSTGDELVELDQSPLPFQIRNSNSYSLAAQVLALGGEPCIQPIAADSDQALEQAVRAAAEEGCDLLLVSGGVSMGKYDLVEGVLVTLGARFFFTGVRMQPGKPVVFGELAQLGRGRLPFFGLPGNPVSTLVTFALFAAPIVAALGGERGYAPRFVEARLTEAASPKRGLRRFLPARLSADADSCTVTLVPWEGSGDVAGTAQANCLVVVPELEPSGTASLTEGSQVRVLLF